VKAVLPAPHGHLHDSCRSLDAQARYRARRSALTVTLTTALLVALAGCAVPPDRSGAADPRAAPEGASGFRSGLGANRASRQMAAAANPLAAEAGRDILAAGGSALDAAIAMQMVLTLVEPQSSGIGGGAFLLHWDGKRVQSFDGRETAPRAVDERLFLAADGRPLPFMDAVVGGRAVGTPGVLRMLELAHKQHGRLPWARLFEPAIALAERGFAMSPRLHTLLAAEKALARSPAARDHFYAGDGSPRTVGTLVRNPALALTLRQIARDGADAFYRGPIADDIIAAVRGHPVNPGMLSRADLAEYRAVERPPLCSDYRQWRICGMGPPSSGGLAIAQMLGMLERHDLAAQAPGAGPAPQPTAQAVHLMSEAARLAYADRALYVADPDFVPLDTRALVDPAYLRARSALIGERSMGRASAGVPPGAPTALAPDASPPRVATSHLSAVDRFGSAISMTTSIEDAFGARVMVRGFLLNNQLTDFSFAPREGNVPIANRVQPGKRPRSSMAPTLVFDRASGDLVATLGSPGGSQIINYVAKTLVGVLDWRMSIDAAIALPNFGSRNGPTELEQGQAAASLADALRARGHDVRLVPMTSGLQGIVRLRDGSGRQAGWAGGADPRREGVAVGD
jgi:gamma-glutamyltranspeptidase / glutathione hydrolase